MQKWYGNKHSQFSVESGSASHIDGMFNIDFPNIFPIQLFYPEIRPCLIRRTMPLRSKLDKNAVDLTCFFWLLQAKPTEKLSGLAKSQNLDSLRGLLQICSWR